VRPEDDGKLSDATTADDGERFLLPGDVCGFLARATTAVGNRAFLAVDIAGQTMVRDGPARAISAEVPVGHRAH